eukprot:14831-Heterococcus_DN1.PRE.2
MGSKQGNDKRNFEHRSNASGVHYVKQQQSSITFGVRLIYLYACRSIANRVAVVFYKDSRWQRLSVLSERATSCLQRPRKLLLHSAYFNRAHEPTYGLASTL